MNNAVLNMVIQMSLWDPAFNSFRHVPRSGIVGSWLCPHFENHLGPSHIPGDLSFVAYSICPSVGDDKVGIKGVMVMGLSAEGFFLFCFVF